MAEMEPVAIQSTQPDWDINHQEEPPKRRRPVRKRKRRPITSSEEDLVPQERHVYNADYRPYQHEQYTQQTGTIRRRRKQFDSRQSERPNTWVDETVDADRPLIRKRGHKRKRPSVEAPWPELSEFNIRRPNDNTGENNDEGYVQPTESAKYGGDGSYDNAGEVYLQTDDTIIKTDFQEINPNKYKIHQTRYNADNIKNPSLDNTEEFDKSVDEDKSLSEFSIESPSADIITAHEKLSEKAVKKPNETDKLQNNVTLDPHTLKEILKKSNGRSLSEILQQHNLSLVDLLHGKEKAISILKMEETKQNTNENFNDQVTINANVNNEKEHVSKENRRFHNRKLEPKPKESMRNLVIIRNITKEIKLGNFENMNKTDHSTEHPTRSQQYIIQDKINNTEEVSSPVLNIRVNAEATETTTKSSLRRRFPVGIRRRIKMRPMNNTSYKSQLSRDLIALTSRRYQLSRNSSRSREWKDLVPTMVKVNRKEKSEITYEKDVASDFVTTTNIPEETTTSELYEENKSFTLPDVESDPSTTNIQTTFTDPSTETTITFDNTVTENIPTTTITSASTTTLTTTTTAATTTTTTTTTTERPSNKSSTRPVVKASDLRRQAFNNRLKRKRLKQKLPTTEPTQDYAMKDIFGMANLVSASEFIAKVQTRTTNSEDEQDFTTLEDFMTTESTTKIQTRLKPTKSPRTKYLTTHAVIPVEDPEETAKFEIEEILNDTLTSARLSKILMERNMTINELVEHRERGSSHIHLADIFHNASREPNPPEPFLSKSLIEPISKETYPLRALLEANLHDPTAKATTIDPNSTQSHFLNIPVVMDFGNNVNENGENMGIMSLFNNFTKNLKIDADSIEEKEQLIQISVPKSEDDGQGASRESRTLEQSNTDKDLITWKEIIAIMHRGQHNNSINEEEEYTTKAISSADSTKQIILDDDLNDDDDLMVLNDLQHIKDFDNHPSSTSEEKIEVYVQDKTELPQIHGVLNKTSNTAKSVTVATASIIGLAMVLFLLTYVAFRWKQQRSIFRDKQITMRTSRIPSPVFENRKGHKNNSSTRSKSPMISSSNIYTIDTLDTRNGNDSPEYMWDTLRKPFQ